MLIQSSDSNLLAESGSVNPGVKNRIEPERKGFQEYLEIRDQFDTPFEDYLEGTRSEISQ